MPELFQNSIKRNSKLKAFTLLELLVIMVVVGVLMGISVAGFAIYRANTALQAGSSDIVSVFRSNRNAAQNSSSYFDTSTNTYRWTYFYGFRANGNNLESFYCFDKTSALPIDANKASILSAIRQNTLDTIPHSASYKCDILPSQTRSLSNLLKINTVGNDACRIFAFETITGKVNVGTGTTVPQPECLLKITSGGQVKNMKIIDNSDGLISEI